jgi:hypothetical protein
VSLSNIDNMNEANETVTGDASIHQNTFPESTPPVANSVIFEKLVLCAALFFPLFLASLDTSISENSLN